MNNGRDSTVTNIAIHQKEINMTYKNIILDDSILDIDSWLPETAIDDIISILNELEDDQTEQTTFK